MTKLSRGIMLGNQQSVHQRSFPTSATHNFYIYGEIQDHDENIVDCIMTLDLASENDIVNIFINTPGGSLETTISLVHAMLRTEAMVITHADGMVASAGTLIFFAGQSYVVYPYSTLMVHDYSGGVDPYGKGNENLKRLLAGNNLINRMTQDLYVPVFSEEEVGEILEGKDVYLDSDELIERIKKAYNPDEDEPTEDDLSPELLVE
jgi:ATP-dependent protease ClpP protease subunit